MPRFASRPGRVAVDRRALATARGDVGSGTLWPRSRPVNQENTNQSTAAPSIVEPITSNGPSCDLDRRAACPMSRSITGSEKCAGPRAVSAAGSAGNVSNAPQCGHADNCGELPPAARHRVLQLEHRIVTQVMALAKSQLLFRRSPGGTGFGGTSLKSLEHKAINRTCPAGGSLPRQRRITVKARGRAPCTDSRAGRRGFRPFVRAGYNVLVNQTRRESQCLCSIIFAHP